MFGVGASGPVADRQCSQFEAQTLVGVQYKDGDGVLCTICRKYSKENENLIVFSALLQRLRPGAQLGRRTLARPLLLSQRQAGAPTRLARPASPEVRTSTVAPWLVAGGVWPRCRGAWRAVARGVWAQPSALWRLGGRGRGEACAAASPRAAARRGSLVLEKLVWVILGGPVLRAAGWRARGAPGRALGRGYWMFPLPQGQGDGSQRGLLRLRRRALRTRKTAARTTPRPPAFAPLPLRSEPRVAVPVG